MSWLHLRATILGILGAWVIRFGVGWREIKRFGLEWQAIFFAMGWAGGIIYMKTYIGWMGFSMPAIKQALELCGGG